MGLDRSHPGVTTHIGFHSHRVVVHTISNAPLVFIEFPWRYSATEQNGHAPYFQKRQMVDRD